MGWRPRFHNNNMDRANFLQKYFCVFLGLEQELGFGLELIYLHLVNVGRVAARKLKY